MLRGLGRMIAEGRAGSLLVILMIAVIWIFFQFTNSNFLSAGNLTNLMLQNVAVATISIGVVLVLLLGEIDLSVGSVSGLCAAIMAVLIVKHDVAPVLAVVAAIGVGALIGLFTGFMITRFGIPSFVITLAGLLTWLGLQLYVLGETGTINLSDNFVTKLTSTFFSPLVGWIIAIAAIVIMFALALLGRARRSRAGLPLGSSGGMLARLDRHHRRDRRGDDHLQPGPRPAPRHPDRHGAGAAVRLHHRADALRPAHLRRRRQRRGGAALGHPDQPGAHHRLRARPRHSRPRAASSPPRGCWP